MTRALLTGATGFLGRQTLDLLREDHEVFSLTRRPGQPDTDGVNWIHADLAQPLAEQALPSDVDVIIHLAQSTRYKELPTSMLDVFRVNAQSTFELLDFGRRVGARKFVLASTGAVYQQGPAILSEGDAVAPRGAYAASKRCAELAVEAVASSLSSAILRLFFIYGPGQEGRLIPSLVQKVEKGEKVLIEGTHGLCLNPVFVDEAARAVVAAATEDATGVINVAGPEALTLRRLVELIGELVETEPLIESQGDNPKPLVGDTSRMRAKLGIQPITSPKEGLQEVLRGGRL